MKFNENILLNERIQKKLIDHLSSCDKTLFVPKNNNQTYELRSKFVFIFLCSRISTNSHLNINNINASFKF